MLMVKVAKRGTKQLIVALSKYTFSLTESAGVLMKIRNKQRLLYRNHINLSWYLYLFYQ